jgi:uncharacterized damage-inducible protein DinB
MAMNQPLLMEFEREMGNTRRALERIPESTFAWRPHPRSNTMGWLVSHIANIPHWAVATLTRESFDVQPPGTETYTMPEARTSVELMQTFDKNVAECRTALAVATDEQLMAPWSLLKGGETMFSMPRIAVLRGMIMNHLVHHRGQLTVYQRMNDIPVPSLYGPSADEGF